MKIIIILAIMAAVLLGISNLDVANKSDRVTSGYQDASSDMYMTLINAKGQTREHQMKLILLEKQGKK